MSSHDLHSDSDSESEGEEPQFVEPTVEEEQVAEEEIVSEDEHKDGSESRVSGRAKVPKAELRLPLLPTEDKQTILYAEVTGDPDLEHETVRLGAYEIDVKPEDDGAKKRLAARNASFPLEDMYTPPVADSTEDWKAAKAKLKGRHLTTFPRDATGGRGDNWQEPIHVATTLFKFESPLMHAANQADTALFIRDTDPVGKKLALMLRPGSIEHSEPRDKGFADRRLHFVPTSIRILSARNTTDVGFEVKLETPNLSTRRVNLFAPISHSVGGVKSVSLKKHKGLTSGDSRLFPTIAPGGAVDVSEVYTLRPEQIDALTSPEARRWACVDVQTELMDLQMLERSVVQQVIKDVTTDVEVVRIPLTTTPKTFLEYIVANFSAALRAECKLLGLARPIREADSEQALLRVPIQALENVITHFATKYDPSIYAVNQHSWQLTLEPHDLTTLDVMGKRKPFNPAQIEVLVEVTGFEFPYTPAKTEKGVVRSLNDSIDAHYQGVYMEFADRVERVYISRINEEFNSERSNASRIHHLTDSLSSSRQVRATTSDELAKLPHWDQAMENEDKKKKNHISVSDAYEEHSRAIHDQQRATFTAMGMAPVKGQIGW